MKVDVILYPPTSGPDGVKVSRYEDCSEIEFVTNDGDDLLSFRDSDGDQHQTSLPFEVITRGEKS